MVPDKRKLQKRMLAYGGSGRCVRVAPPITMVDASSLVGLAKQQQGKRCATGARRARGGGGNQGVEVGEETGAGNMKVDAGRHPP